LTIIVDGLEIKPISARIFRVLDAPGDGWSAVIPWTPGEKPTEDKILVPGKYNSAAVYIGNALIIAGYISDVSPSLTESGRTKVLKGWSFTVDPIDSDMFPPFEANKITLEQRASELMKPFGIKIEIQNADEVKSYQFERLTAGHSEKVAQHLQKVASQLRVLTSSTQNGDLLFTKADTEAETYGSLEEGSNIIGSPSSYAMIFEGRKRFNTWKGAGAFTYLYDKNPKYGIAKDDTVPRTRFKNFQTNDFNQQNVADLANWKRNLSITEAIRFNIPVTSWLAPNGKLWATNKKVSVKSKTLFIPDGYTFLIQRIEYVFDNTGKTAFLSLVFPQIYTGEDIKIPWL
jgi:prophage tail gpP-like protein